MDQPIFVTGGKEDVASGSAGPVEHDHDLVVSPLLGVVGAVIPDGDLTRAVLTFGNGPLELSVVQRVIFDVHGQVIGVGVHGKTLWECPRNQDTVSF